MTAPGSAPHVFVSSTSVDLTQHRAAVRETLLRMGLFPDAMETWGAQPHGDPATVSVEKVRGCAAMVLIVAWRYGFVPAGETRSITQLEYLEATSAHRPCYVFLADPATESADEPFPHALRDPEHAAALAAFRAQLGRDKVVAFFTTPADLAQRVATSLSGVRPAAEFAPLTPHDARVLPQPPRAAIRAGSGEGGQRGLIGRDEELHWLSRQLRDPSSKGIWALRGMGGVGKTALVAVAVANNEDHFSGGIAVIRALNRGVLDVVTADEVLRELVGKFVQGGDGLLKRPGVTWQELSDALVNVLLQLRAQRRPALVVIDNVEHELAQERGFRDLLELLNAGGVSVVLTSRQQLGSYVQESRELSTLDSDGAIELFARVSGRYPAGITADDHRALAHICEVFQGHALATVVAAATFGAMPTLSPAAFRQRLTEGFAVLELSGFEAPQGVGAVFASSHDHLDPGARAVHAALGVLVEHGCTIAAAVALGMASGQDEAAAHTYVSQLITASLVTKVGDRIDLHPIAQEFTRLIFGRLPTREQDRVRDALAAHYAEWTPGHPSHELAPDEGNIVLALDWATRTAPRSDRWLARLAYGLRWYWDDQYDPAQAARWLPAGYEAMARVERRLWWRRGALAVWRRRRSAVGFALGIQYQLNGDIDAARRWFERSHRAALLVRRGTGDTVPLAEAWSGLAAVAQQQGLSDVARQRYQRSLDLYSAANDHRGQADAHYRLGFLALRVGECATATAHFTRSLGLLTDAPEDQRLRSVNEYSLANVAHQRGQVELALRQYEQTLAACERDGNRRGQGAILKALGDLAWQTTGPREALEFLERSQRRFREIFDHQALGVAQYSIAFMHRQVGRIDEATSYYERSLALRLKTKDKRGEGFVRKAVGDVRRRTAGTSAERGPAEATAAQVAADMAQARGHLDQGRELSRGVGDRRNEGVALKALGDWAWQSGDLAFAHRCYRDSLELRQLVEDRHGEVVTTKVLADLAMLAGRFEEARRLLTDCGAAFEELRDKRGRGAVLHSQALLAWHGGDRATAVSLARQSLTEVAQVDDIQSQAVVLHTLGGLAGASGEAHYRDGLELADRARAVHIFALLEAAHGAVLVGGPHPAQGRRLQSHAAQLLLGLGRADDAERVAAAPAGEPTFAATIYDLDEGPNGQGFAIPNDRRRTSESVA